MALPSLLILLPQLKQTKYIIIDSLSITGGGAIPFTFTLLFGASATKQYVGTDPRKNHEHITETSTKFQRDNRGRDVGFTLIGTAQHTAVPVPAPAPRRLPVPRCGC